MRTLDYHESIQRGSLDFPLDYHHITDSHPRYQMPYHWHEECEILHVIKGVFTLTVDDSAHTLREGDVAFIGTGCLHGGTPEGCEYECVVFDMRLLMRASDHCKQYISDILYGRIRVRPHFAADSAEIRLALAPMFDALRAQTDGCALITLGCLFMFVGEIYRLGSYTSMPSSAAMEAASALRLKKVFELIETRYRQPLSLAQLSAAVGMSPKYFCRFFRQTTHRTPMDYVNYYRVEQACYQMDATDCNVTEAALDNGFDDVNYFIRVFRRYKGITPGQYLRRLKSPAVI